VRQDRAEKETWASIEDLREAAADLTAGFTAEFAERPDGYPGLQKAYEISFQEIRDLDPSLMYRAIVNGEVDVICAFATDGRISAYQLKTLDDDEGFFPPYHAAPVITESALKAYPQLENVLDLAADLLDNGKMRRLNLEVDQEKRQPYSVVETFLKSEGLL
jgi:glycine betaine/choline ABC-type transport system substrate-binding protein